jgi:uncharacterized protein YecT (DUF1311 family)
VDTTDFEKDIADAMAEAPKKQLPPARTWSGEIKPTSQPVYDSIKPTGRSPTLAEDWETHRAIGAALRDKLRKEKAKLLTEHDIAWLDLRHRYEQRISDTIADMRAELEAEQRRMVEAYQAKTRELDLLAQRVEDDG